MRAVHRAGSALLLLTAVVAGPGGLLRAPAACAAATAGAGAVRVAFAVDFGGAPGAPSSGVVLTCVPASSGSAADALQARAQQLGTPLPRYASSGLLCAIDGFPASGCGERTGNGYAYWSYWHGTGNSWSYAVGGPAGWQVASGDLEGWRFQDPGTGTAADPPPRAAPNASAICPPVAPPPSNAPPPTNKPPTSAPQASAPTIRPPTSRATAAPVSQPATTVTTTTVAGRIAPGPPATDTTSTLTVTTGAPTAAGRTGVALSPTRLPHQKGNGPPWSVLIGGLAIVLLGGAAWWRMRRPAGAA